MLLIPQGKKYHDLQALLVFLLERYPVIMHEKFFNTEGPIDSEDHYYLPQRLSLASILQLIARKKYFILHAPRQTGKTTSIISLIQEINQAGNFYALYVNVEPAQAARSRVREGIFAILSLLESAIELQFGPEEPALSFFHHLPTGPGDHLTILTKFLRFWASHATKPLVLFIDEIDSLVGDTLISVLRQLRAGYLNRPKGFPQSLCLIGVRDVRGYRIWSEEKESLILGGSAFNIKAESLTLSSFSKQEVKKLLLQHTKTTAQIFEPDAVNYLFEQTQGQPWLVNALAFHCCFRKITDRKQPITKEIMVEARDELILRRDTHLDVLLDRLLEPRVCQIIDAIIQGRRRPEEFPVDNISYLLDLGLLVQKGQTLEIANPIYQEVIPRELIYGTQLSLTQKLTWYQKKDGSLDVKKLFEAFTQFYRENSEIWLEKFAYKESGPHLLLMAFLQRVVNGGGKVHREYALGRGRVDLLIEFRLKKIVVEIKLLRSSKTLEQGLTQTAKYMRQSHASEGHLVIFDRSPEKTWDEKISHQTRKAGNQTVHVWTL